MRYLLTIVLLVAGIGCGSAPQRHSLVGSFRGKAIRPNPPRDGAFTNVVMPTYEVGVTFGESEFSGSQRRDDQDPIVIRGKYELLGGKQTLIRFVAQEVANDVVLLDGVFSYSLKDKSLILTKPDGSLTIELTKLPER